MATIELPEWACAGRARRAHIERVTSLLVQWATAMRIPAEECAAWRDAGQWHDALRDANDRTLRALVPGSELPVRLLHGPAAAVRLERDGEGRQDVLDAIRWHTLGRAEWTRTGDALYMADFLEPGRPFDEARREDLARHVPTQFAAVLREVVHWRLTRAIERDRPIHAETQRFWERVR